MYDTTKVPQVADLAVSRGGVLHLDECLDLGLSYENVRWLLESGRWQSPFPRTLVAFSGPIPPLTLMEAALRYAGTGAALCGRSAGALWGLCDGPEDIHVLVAYEREVEDQPGLKIHRSRTITEDDIHPAFAPTRTRIERTVCDMLRNRPTAGSALALVADAIRSRTTTPERLRAVLEALPCTRWRSAVLTALPDVTAGAHSLLEIYDARLRRRHGLPPGTRQFVRRRNGVEHLDVYLEEYRVHVELDGTLGHDRAAERWRDFRRDNASEVRQIRHLRYGWADTLGDGCGVMIEQAVVLRQQGWTGRFRRCRRCPHDLPPEL